MKKAFTWLLVLLVIYFVVTAPAQAADVVRGAGQATQTALASVLSFLDSLTPSP